MKKILVAFSLFLLFSTYSMAWAVERFKFDGYKWNQMDRLLKLGFVMGWCLAGEHAITVMGLLRGPGLDIVMKEYERAQNFSIVMGLSFGGLMGSQLVDTVDKLYSDPRLKIWEIHEIMPLVRGRLIEGWTEKDLDEIIAFEIRHKILADKVTQACKSDKLQCDQAGKEFLDHYNRYMPEALKVFNNRYKWKQNEDPIK